MTLKRREPLETFGWLSQGGIPINALMLSLGGGGALLPRP